MWNWLVSALAVGASVVLYDGSPLMPTANVLWYLTEQLGWVILVWTLLEANACKKIIFLNESAHNMFWEYFYILIYASLEREYQYRTSSVLTHVAEKLLNSVIYYLYNIMFFKVDWREQTKTTGEQNIQRIIKRVSARGKKKTLVFSIQPQNQ